jgi:chromosome segregation ATPase
MASYKRLWEDSKTEISDLEDACKDYYDKVQKLNKQIRNFEERYEVDSEKHYLLAQRYIDLKNKMINVAEGGCEECDKKQEEIEKYKGVIYEYTTKEVLETTIIREYGSLIYEKEKHIETLREQKEVLKKRYKKIRRFKLAPYIVCAAICVLTIIFHNW